MARKTFNSKEIEILRKNPYTRSVTENQLSFTYEFKLFVAEKIQQNVPIRRIMKDAGYDIEIIGKERMYMLSKRIRKELRSPEGIRKSRRKSREEYLAEFAARDLEEMKQKKAIRLLQEEIIMLSQEVEFLKKIASLEASAASNRKDTS